MGHCGFQLMLVGAQSPQDLRGGGAVEGEGEEKWGEGSCVWPTADSVCLQRAQDWKGLMWKGGSLLSFLLWY